MTEFRKLEEGVLVAGQLTEADIEEAAEQGIRVIINNRPDGEVPGQPESAALEAKAHELGLEYAYMPVVSGRITPEQIEEFGEALEAGDEVLAFCRTGNRSACLWGLARAMGGGDPHDLADAAAGAGYDLSGLLPMMEELAKEA
ncbi:MAG: TIGR01244 family sulfur transferase [Alphaproteobacteria bacterium]